VPRWDPNGRWQGESTYIIGGGPSLRSFDWDLIRGKRTIGCNSAFLLGAHICQITIFADHLWWEEIGKKRTDEYGGLVVGCVPPHNEKQLTEKPWLIRMSRYDKNGLSPPGSQVLGCCGNTGVLALNLALLMGATRVYLLGFDMRLGPQGIANWHHLRWEPPQADNYPRFMREMRRLPQELKEKYPDVQVVNVTDDSELELFPKQSLREHFSQVKEGVE
jgi:hypothetical protein